MPDAAAGTASAHNPTILTEASSAELEELLAARRVEYEAGADDRLIAGLEKSLEKFEGHVTQVKAALKAARQAKKDHAAERKAAAEAEAEAQQAAKAEGTDA